MPTTGNETAVNRFLGPIRICVKNLRIKFITELDDLIFCDINRAKLMYGPLHSQISANPAGIGVFPFITDEQLRVRAARITEEEESDAGRSESGFLIITG